ncbi:hypothetical protein [Arvimicrobium flavum]|uniref:hypothetical protein n=1 Tax=Arvimicrobium flavum TaxID=3393320 RepID=UPI00237A7B9E|nr:hypothetical protein [Mesorhizobium shangrilense]
MHRTIIAVLGAAACSAPAAAQDFDPAGLDLAAMIRCDMDARDYNAFAMWFATNPDAAARLGWSAADSQNPFLGQYSIETPVEVFGHATRDIAFTSTGPLAVLKDVAPRELAGTLGVDPMIDTPEKFLGQKILEEKTEDVGGTTIETTVVLNVSTVDTHPGATLAGCSYSVEVK